MWSPAPWSRLRFRPLPAPVLAVYGPVVNARAPDPPSLPAAISPQADLAFASHPEAMWLLDRRTGRFLDVNAAALARYGYDKASFLALHLRDLRVPEEHEALDRELHDLALAAPAPGFEPVGIRVDTVWHRRSNGNRFPVRIQSDDVLWAGVPARLVLAHDLSEQHALRQAVHDTYDRVSDGIVTFDWGRRYTYVNPSAARLLGLSGPHELIGRHIWEAFPSRVGSNFHAAFERAMQDRLATVVDEDFYPATQHWFESRLHPTPDGLTVFFTDVTERHAAAEELLARKRDFRLLAEQLPAITYRAELSSPYATLWISPQVQALGYSATEWVRNPSIWVERLHPDDRARAQADLSEGLSTRGEAQTEYRLLTADGRWLHFQDLAKRVDPGDGRPACIQGVMIDITVRRRAEAALEVSRQRLVSLTQRLLTQEKETTQRLAQTLHDGLGQTLAIARLHQDAVLAALPTGSAALDAAARVGAGLAEAVQLVRQVLVDLRPPLLAEHGLAAALDNEIRTVPRREGMPVASLEIRLRGTGSHWSPDVEYGAFMVAREAISNALQHARARRVRVQLGGSRRSLRLDVIDDGIGIDPLHVAGRAGHMGIVGMHERALAIGAMVAVQRRARGGTHVSLRWTTQPKSGQRSTGGQAGAGQP
jgi:PAS domain S-box-containing protein